MAITYTWRVTSMKTTTVGEYQNAVVQTYWEKIGSDENGNTGIFTGATPFTVTDVPPDQFVPYNELTEEIVLSWIQAVVIDDYEQHVNTQIQKQIDLQIDPVTPDPLPWVANTSPSIT